MKTAGALVSSLGSIAEEARELEAQGADIGTTVELGHDPLMQLAMAATARSPWKWCGKSNKFGPRFPVPLFVSSRFVDLLLENENGPVHGFPVWKSRIKSSPQKRELLFQIASLDFLTQ